jgi:hypothetical protein
MRYLDLMLDNYASKIGNDKDKLELIEDLRQQNTEKNFANLENIKVLVNSMMREVNNTL